MVPESGFGEFWGSRDCCWNCPRLIVTKGFGASQSPARNQSAHVLSLVVLRIVPTGGWEIFYDLEIGAGNVVGSEILHWPQSPPKKLRCGWLGSASDSATPVRTSFG